MKKIHVLLLLVVLTGTAVAQSAPATSESLRGWHLKAQQDGYFGIELEAAYRFLTERKIISEPVIVAVLDSGIDTLHEDLKSVLWTNPGEIPGNGKDDDGNGSQRPLIKAITDVRGWYTFQMSHFSTGVVNADFSVDLLRTTSTSASCNPQTVPRVTLAPAEAPAKSTEKAPKSVGGAAN